MSSDSVSTTAVSSSSERYTGRVKWFNNKAGYGFVTVTDGPMSGSDVFVHHSSVKVDSEQYKYLVQGEYVEFSILDTNTGDHEHQAGDVCGIKGGKLMCETRRDTRTARTQYRSETSEPVKQSREPRPQREARTRGQGPREEQPDWTYVSKARKGVESQTSQTPSSKRGRGRPPRGKPADTSA
jgi:CspA family cold shock protein